MTLAPARPEVARPRTRAATAEVRARLRRMIADIEGRAPRPREAPRPSEVAEVSGDPPRDLLATATRRETDRGPLTYREVVFPLSHVAGHQSLADIVTLSPATLGLLAPDEGLEDAVIADLYFLDIETTGLGGAGAIAFLVATARFEVDGAGVPSALVLSQYLAESPPEEAGVLEALIEDARFADDPVLVTYNGRTFDGPLLDERATMHRRRAGFEGLRQLDLLRPARTSYRGLLRNCKLATLEHQVLGMTRPSEDIPGAEVPHWYFRFLRTGDQRMLNPIVEHNELDIIGMVGLLAWHARYLDAGGETTPRDALGLGRLLAARGQNGRAAGYLERATLDEAPSAGAGDEGEGTPRMRRVAPGAGRPATSPFGYSGRTVHHPAARNLGGAAGPNLDGADGRAVREEALLRLAALYKRTGERHRAAELWHRAIALPARAPLEPLIELAIYYEHHHRDFARAIAHAEQAATHVMAELRPHDPRRATRWLETIEHRLARLHSRAEPARRSA